MLYAKVRVHTHGHSSLKSYEYIGNVEDLIFMSNRPPSRETSISNIFPPAYHGVCGIHLYFNIASKYGSNNIVHLLFWDTCKMYTFQDIDDGIKKKEM